MGGTVTEKQVRAKAGNAEVWLLLGTLAAVAVTAMIVLARADWNEDLRLELAKTALTALSLTVVGSIASLAVWLYQKRREVELNRALDIERERRDEVKKAKEEVARRESDARREQAERQIQAEENLRRKAERLRDTRARDDALLRSLLQDTLRSYNRVKRIRRLLKARLTRTVARGAPSWSWSTTTCIFRNS